MKFFSRLGMAVLTVMLVAACATTQDDMTPDAAPAPDAQARDAAAMERERERQRRAEAEALGAPGERGFVGDPLDDPDSLLSKRVIYFEFDRAEIKPEFREIIEAHAQYLNNNSNTRVVLEGHTDERGTREYNMGLGERRANAVRQLFTLQGVASNQIETVSYGEERPVALGNDEESWRLNRRVEIVYR